MSNDILTVDEALAEIKQRIKPLHNYQTMLLPNALGRTLAEAVISPIDVPGYKNSAMDGYAFASDDLPVSGSKKLIIAGTAFAGNPYEDSMAAGECLRIMTGAKIPEALDTVIEQEKVQLDGEAIVIDASSRAGQNVRHIGEDIAKDSTVLSAGSIVGAAQMGVLASLGIASLQIRRRLRVAVFSSGDEIRSIGESLDGSQIYDSNRYTITSLLKNLGVEVIDLGVVADTEADIQQTLKDAAVEADMIITSGGVSVGDADYIKQALEANGEMYFSKLHLKPGRPLTFGRINQTVFFGLPGNPVAVMVTFMYFVRPAIKQLMDNRDYTLASFEVPCLSDLRKVSGRTEVQRGILTQDNEQGLVVRSSGKQGSGVLSSMSSANCFIYLSHHRESVQAGEKVIVHPFSSFD